VPLYWHNAQYHCTDTMLSVILLNDSNAECHCTDTMLIIIVLTQCWVSLYWITLFWVSLGLSVMCFINISTLGLTMKNATQHKRQHLVLLYWCVLLTFRMSLYWMTLLLSVIILNDAMLGVVVLIILLSVIILNNVMLGVIQAECHMFY
jgi:hypothetical protein